MAYEVISTPTIHPDGSDEWETLVSLKVRRDDGVEAEVWLSAGVPEWQRGTAKASGSRREFETVYTPDLGGGWDSWCGFERPESEGEAYDMIEEIREAARKVALKCHRQQGGGR
jgi:hypothetical protein